MVSMAVEDEEAIVLKLWNCFSTSISVGRGLEGTLADRRWKAMSIVEAVSFRSSGNGETAAMVSSDYGLPPYITKTSLQALKAKNLIDDKASYVHEMLIFFIRLLS
jgi:hypothetical protein